MGLATLFSCCQPIISVLLSIIYSIQLFSSLRFHLLRPSPKMYPKLISGELCPYLYHRIFKAKFWAETRAHNSHFTGSYSQASKIGFGYRFHSNLSSTGRPKIVPKRSSKEGGTWVEDSGSSIPGSLWGSSAGTPGVWISTVWGKHKTGEKPLSIQCPLWTFPIHRLEHLKWGFCARQWVCSQLTS